MKILKNLIEFSQNFKKWMKIKKTQSNSNKIFEIR